LIEYPKIPTVFQRDPANNHKTLLDGVFSSPELEFLANNRWVFTEKVDGTNVRVSVRDGAPFFQGRKDSSHLPGPLLDALHDIFSPVSDELAALFPDEEGCLFGEGYGGRIQKAGKDYALEESFVLFDVECGGWWLRRPDVEDVAKKLGIGVVPIIGEGDLMDMVARVQCGFRSQWGDFAAEGIVARA